MRSRNGSFIEWPLIIWTLTKWTPTTKYEKTTTKKKRSRRRRRRRLRRYIYLYVLSTIWTPQSVSYFLLLLLLSLDGLFHFFFLAPSSSSRNRVIEKSQMESRSRGWFKVNWRWWTTGCLHCGVWSQPFVLMRTSSFLQFLACFIFWFSSSSASFLD